MARSYLSENSRLEEGRLLLDRRPLDLRTVIDDVAQGQAVLLGSAHRLEVLVPDDAVQVLADQVRVALILNNLIDNARKYSPGGGVITVRLSLDDDRELDPAADGAQHGESARSDDIGHSDSATRDSAGSGPRPAPASAVIMVADGGIGIDAENMAVLFTRFGRIITRETSNIPGVGLGLHLCRELARLHGGDIAAVSMPGVGSTFTVRLPLLDPDSANATPVAAPLGVGVDAPRPAPRAAKAQTDLAS